MFIRRVLACGVLLALVQPVSAQESGPSFDRKVKPFLADHCVKCHGAKQQKAERRFDTLPGRIGSDNTLVDYQDILDQLNLSAMPPEDSAQPSLDQRREIIEWFTSRIADYHKSRQATSNRTVLRRLNAREYRNTVRDLFNLNVTIFDPTIPFPADQMDQHLDNVGETLVTSGYLLSRYLDAGERIVDRALYPLKKPEVQTWTFRDGFRQQPEIDQVHRRTNKFKHMTLYDVIGADKPEGAYGPIDKFRKGVPHDGFYEIRFKAEAVNREHPYAKGFVGTDPSEPFRVGIVPGNHLVGELHLPQPIEPLLAEVELTDEMQWHTARVWLDAGYTPRFTFRNGLLGARSLWTRLVKRYRDQFPETDGKRLGIVLTRYNAIKFGKLPHVRIHEIQIKGPFFDQWPTASQRALLGENAEQVLASGSFQPDRMREQLVKVMRDAYRREPRPAEVDRVAGVIEAQKKVGRSDLEAYIDGVKVVLCSPGFLYLKQGGAKNVGQVWSTELVERLSYFLWSSKPDDALAKLAASKTELDPVALDAQVERMLGDSRSDAFVDGFLDSWLTLRDLGSTPPERREFSDFYRYELGAAMREETRLFTKALIDENLSLLNFLDSDFTFVNKPLAKHYGLVPPPGQGFHRVKLSDKRRGGLLGQASVLTVTANGIDTSPVVRGVWLLENVLGTPPSPPPPDIEPLDPDVRGTKTIRDQLEKHRSTPSCFECHRKIDPLGFALENFDPIGGWRTNYDRKRKVDSAGELPGGRKFSDIRGLKKVLLERKDQFTRALTEKMMAYATGRHMTVSDRPEIDRIVTEVAQRGYGFRDLIKLIVTSKTFSQ